MGQFKTEGRKQFWNKDLDFEEVKLGLPNCDMHLQMQNTVTVLPYPKGKIPKIFRIFSVLEYFIIVLGQFISFILHWQANQIFD